MISWVVDNLSLQADDSLIIIFNPSWMSMKNFMHSGWREGLGILGIYIGNIGVYCCLGMFRDEGL